MSTVIQHGDNAECPDVRSGRWTHCKGHNVKDSMASVSYGGTRCMVDVRFSIHELTLRQQIDMFVDLFRTLGLVEALYKPEEFKPAANAFDAAVSEIQSRAAAVESRRIT